MRPSNGNPYTNRQRSPFRDAQTALRFLAAFGQAVYELEEDQERAAYQEAKRIFCAAIHNCAPEEAPRSPDPDRLPAGFWEAMLWAAQVRTAVSLIRGGSWTPP